jgi:hypothetical protein
LGSYAQARGGSPKNLYLKGGTEERVGLLKSGSGDLTACGGSPVFWLFLKQLEKHFAACGSGKELLRCPNISCSCSLSFQTFRLRLGIDVGIVNFITIGIASLMVQCM